MEMRGLSKVIGEIRKASAQSKEEEQKIIDRELHKVRQKFKETKNMKGYDRKKNVCKLLYVYMLGYEVDFGQMEGVQLLSSDKYSEKHIGYLACTLFLNEQDDLLTLITHSIKQDLNGGRNPSGAITKDREFAQCLALTALANIGGKDFADSMADDVRRISLSQTTTNLVKKKALMTLLRLYRSSPEKVEAEEIAPTLIEDLNPLKTTLSVVNSTLSLVLGFLGKTTEPFAGVVPRVVRLLYRLIISKETSHEYIYYTVPAPWLQVKCFRVLQHFPMPTEGSLKNQITSVLDKIITTSERVMREHTHQKSRGTPARNNAMNAVLAEAINLVIHWDKDRSLLNMSAGILGRFITDTKDTNLRYLGLDLMVRLSFCPEVFNEHVKKHQTTIVSALRDADISIRRKALDLLYVMVDKSNAGEIVGEMLDYLSTAEYAIKEDLVVKIAILCEKYASDYSWYVDVIMNIISQAGDFVSPDVWMRVVHIVTNHVDIQKHAARTVFTAVIPPTAHEVSVKVATHILGEFGSFLPDVQESNAWAQFQALHGKWGLVSAETKSLLLSCYAKLYTQYPENAQLREKVLKVFSENSTHMDVEIQQRSMEYSHLCNGSILPEEKLQKVFENMPAFEVEQSKVHQSVIKKGGDTTDSNVWQAKQEERERESQIVRKTEDAAKGQMTAQALDNWRAHAKAGVFTQDAKALLKQGIQQRIAQNHLNVWDADANQPWEAFLASAAVCASHEGQLSTPPCHSDQIMFSIGSHTVSLWRQHVFTQMQEPLSDTNLLGLQGCSEHILDSAVEDLDAKVAERTAELGAMFPNRGKEVVSSSGLEDPFAGQPTQTAEAAAPSSVNLLDDIFGDPVPAPTPAAATPTPTPAAVDPFFGGAATPAPTPTPTPAPAVGGLDDIFGAPAPAATAAPTPVPVSTQNAAPPQAVLDPFGGLPSATPAPSQTPVAGGGAPWADPAAVAKMQSENLPLLMRTAQGVLYEDEKLQLGVRSEYRGPDGRLMIFFGNKTQETLNNATVTVAPFAGLDIQQQPFPSSVCFCWGEMSGEFFF